MEIYHPRDEELIREMRRVRRSYKRKRLIWGFLILLILSIAAGIFVFNRYYRLAVTHGSAMGSTLPEGSLVLVRKTEEGTGYQAGDIILYEKRFTKPVEVEVLSEKGKPRKFCKYILYREMGTTKQYYAASADGKVWHVSADKADQFESTEEGIVRLETDDLPNGEYWLREVFASYGHDLLKDPVPFNVNNPEKTQMKRILAAPVDRVVLSPATETRVNGYPISTAYTSGRTTDSEIEARRVNVQQGKYFVQGDQLSLSVDSRNTDYSTVSEAEILGRAEFVIWPVRAFGDLTGVQTTVTGGEPEVAE